MENGTTILFGLPGVAVQRVDAVRLVHVVTTASSAAGCCPQCGVVSTSVKQRRTTRPRDLPYGEEPLAVLWRKRQYRCQEAACPRKAFTESIAEVPPGPADRAAVPSAGQPGQLGPQRGGGRRAVPGEPAGDVPALRHLCGRVADRAGTSGGAGP
jgi:zinc-finger of transposase IS204/IS1001/IS1096/IS1165